MPLFLLRNCFSLCYGFLNFYLVLCSSDFSYFPVFSLSKTKKWARLPVDANFEESITAQVLIAYSSAKQNIDLLYNDV